VVLHPVRIESKLLGLLTQPQEIAARPPAECAKPKPHPLVALGNPGVHCMVQPQDVTHAWRLQFPWFPAYAHSALGCEDDQRSRDPVGDTLKRTAGRAVRVQRRHPRSGDYHT